MRKQGRTKAEHCVNAIVMHLKRRAPLNTAENSQIANSKNVICRKRRTEESALMLSNRKLSVSFKVVILALVLGIILISHLIYSNDKSWPCQWERPCVYRRQVDIRIIILTYNRPTSLQKCLNSTQYLQMDGDQASMEIWIDRNYRGEVDASTVAVSKNFTWPQGPVTVHVQQSHAGLHGQWINTWKPQAGSKELSLFLEDDVDISPYGYVWLKRAWNKYGNDRNLGGIVLQNEYIITAAGRLKGVTFPRPEKDPLFMYPILMPWGFAPNPKYWTIFQDWYHNMKSNSEFLPFVPEAGLYNSWFKDMVKANRTNSMWTMWYNYFCHKNKLHMIYANLPKYTGRSDTRLVCHRKENGLHFNGNTVESCYDTLLTRWSDYLVKWPEHIKVYNYDGTYVNFTCFPCILNWWFQKTS